MSEPKKALAASVTALALTFMGTSVAGASTSAAPKPKVLAKGGLIGVLSSASANNRVYFTDNFTGALYASQPGKTTPTRLFTPTGSFTAEGVAYDKGDIVFGMDKDQGQPSAESYLMRLTSAGKATKIADLLAFEKSVNPDGKFTYGTKGLKQSCIDKVSTHPYAPFVLPYKGIPESHPYAIAVTTDAYYVVDAGANALFKVTKTGRVSNVVVLPSASRAITKEDLSLPPEEGGNLPDCLIGHQFVSESVPTDVEVGPDGQLYVTTLPGGLATGLPFGTLYKIDPMTKKMTTVVSGLIAPTGIAIAPNGTVYLAHPFLGQISMLKKGSKKVTTYASAAGVTSLSWSPQGLVATQAPSIFSGGAPKPDGQVVLYRK